MLLCLRLPAARSGLTLQPPGQLGLERNCSAAPLTAANKATRVSREESYHPSVLTVLTG
jgi:hypothetical protein